MKLSAVWPVLLVCVVSSCGKASEVQNATSATAKEEASTPAAQVAAPSAAPSATNADTPSGQFVAMKTTDDCLGIYAGLAAPDGKERAIAQFATAEDRGFRKLQGFARKDRIASLTPKFDEMVKTMSGKRLITYTDTDPTHLGQYSLEKKSFFDGTQLTGGNELALSKGGNCVLKLVDATAWDQQFTVKDEAQARAADEARGSGNAFVKYYLSAISADAANNSLDWPRVNAKIVRVEIVDKDDKMLARALPVMSEEEAGRSR